MFTSEEKRARQQFSYWAPQFKSPTPTQLRCNSREQHQMSIKSLQVWNDVVRHSLCCKCIFTAFSCYRAIQKVQITYRLMILIYACIHVYIIYVYINMYFQLQIWIYGSCHIISNLKFENIHLTTSSKLSVIEHIGLFQNGKS